MSDFDIKDGILFKCNDKNITHARIPDNVHTIFDGAFGWCTALKTIYKQKDTIIEAHKNAFIGCDKLKGEQEI